MGLRRLTTADWRVYRELRLAALADAPYAYGSTLEAERKLTETDWRKRLATREQFVAYLDGAPAGTVAGVRSDGSAVAELVSMWVRPQTRGHGVGSALVNAVLDWASREGCSEIRLWVSEGNDVAERLYARHGFVRTGQTQPIRADDPTRLEFAMARPVGPPALR